jgi:hypothetical protein
MRGSTGRIRRGILCRDLLPRLKINGKQGTHNEIPQSDARKKHRKLRDFTHEMKEKEEKQVEIN